MKGKVFFRVNVKQNAGMGHWVRCIALAKILEPKFSCSFLIQTDDENLKAQTQQEGFVTQLISTDLDLKQEADYLAQHYFTGQEILVLDGYDFGFEYQQMVKPLVSKLVSIDDIHQSNFISDVVINHSGGITAADYNCTPTTRLYLGLDYLLVRDAFLKTSKESKIQHRNLNKTLIAMGGEDPNNDTLKVLQVCEQIPTTTKFEVVLGSRYRHHKALKAFLKTTKLQIQISQELTAPELAKLMQQCHTAICPPSTMALEYLAISGNLLLHQIADNQKYLYKYLIQNKLAEAFTETPNLNKITARAMTLRQQQIIDGKSPERLLAIFTELHHSSQLRFRQTQKRDMYQYFAWANDPLIRKQSFQSQMIPIAQHKSWFALQMNDSNSEMIVMEEGGIPVGQIRFKLQAKKAVLSYSLDKSARGKGYAKHLIEGGTQLLLQNNPTIQEVVGYVKPQNIPSIKTFKRIGYQDEVIHQPFTQIKFNKQFNHTH